MFVLAIERILGYLVKLKLKMCTFTLNLRILSSISAPFTLTTVQVPNFAITHTKRITVCCEFCPKKYDFLVHT